MSTPEACVAPLAIVRIRITGTGCGLTHTDRLIPSGPVLDRA